MFKKISLFLAAAVGLGVLVAPSPVSAALNSTTLTIGGMCSFAAGDISEWPTLPASSVSARRDLIAGDHYQVTNTCGSTVRLRQGSSATSASSAMTGIVWRSSVGGADLANDSQLAVNAVAYLYIPGSLVSTSGAANLSHLIRQDGAPTSSATGTLTFTVGSPVPSDTTPPTVVSVSSSATDGAYRSGLTLSLQVTFSENVIVNGGNPLLTLETGTTDRTATYSSGSGTSVLTFNYIIQNLDASADLDYVSTSALALNSSSIRDAANNAANLALPSPGASGSLAANKAIVIDTEGPTITTTRSGSGSVGQGQTVTVTFTLSESSVDFLSSDAMASTGTLTNFAGSGTTYTATFTPPTTSSGNASITVTVGSFSDGAGNLSTAGYVLPISYDTNVTTTTTTTTTVPGGVIRATSPTLVTASNQSTLEATPGSAVAVVNGQIVPVETVKVSANASVATLQNTAKEIVADITKLLPAGATNNVTVVNTPQGAELTGLMTNPDDPKEKLNVPVESVTLVKAGNAAVLISALNQTNLPAEVVAGGVIQVTRGGVVAARAYGLTGSQNGEIVLMSTPRLLQTFTVGTNGSYNGQVALPKDISFGSHTIVMATATAKVSLGVQLVRTRLQFRIKRITGTTLFKNRAGVKKAGGKVIISGSGACKATLTKVTMSAKPGACYITVKQAAKGKYPAVYTRFTVSVVKKLVRKK